MTQSFLPFVIGQDCSRLSILPLLTGHIHPLSIGHFQEDLLPTGCHASIDQ